MLLSKQTRKKFLEQDWFKIKSNEDNLSQTMLRLGREVNTGLSDLALLSRRLPDEEHAKIFNVTRIEDFLHSLMNFEEMQGAETIRRPKNYRIAMLLIEQGLTELREIYEHLYKNSPYMQRIVSQNLEETINICKDLTLGVIKSELEFRGLEDNLVYLFSYENLDSYDEVAFGNFVLNSIDKDELLKVAHFLSYVGVRGDGTNYRSDVDYRYNGTIIDYLSNHTIGKASLEFNIRDLTCKLIIDLFGSKVKTRDLIVKKVDNDYVFYAKVK
jgi:hypothetical protein